MYLLDYINKLFYLGVFPTGFGYYLAIIREIQCKGLYIIQGVQLKSGSYFNMSNLFTKIYNIIYYTSNLHLQ